MMYSIVNWSVTFRRLVVAAAAGLLIFGILQLDDAKRDILPEFSPTIVEVQTEALGLSAPEVEQLITVPLEQDLLNGVAFLDEIESASLPGLSSVVLTFEPGTDLLDARQVVTERLTQAVGLPQVAAPPQMVQPLSSTSRVAMVSLSSDEVTPIEMSVLARWVMVPRLLGVEGVANVAIWGFRDQQLQVLVDPAELAAASVTLSQVVSTAGNALEVSPLSFLEASLPGTGGFIDTVNQRLHVFHEQAINTPEELSAVTLEGIEGGAVFVNGEPLTLGDVAQLVTDHQPLIGDALCAGGPCILLVIEKFPNANTPAVAAGVDSALDALSVGLPGIDIDSSIYRPAEFIETSTANLRTALIIGAVLLLLALAVLLMSWRIVVIAAVTLATSLVVAGLILVILDATVNTMILAGLVVALVVIVDDAVIAAWGTGEAVGGDGRPGTASSIMDAILRRRSGAMYAAVIIAAATIPVFAMEGEAGAFLEPIVLAFLLAIASALIVGLTVAPALSVMLLNGVVVPEPVITGRIRNWYRGVAPRLLPHSGRALGVLAVVVAAGVVALTFTSPALRPALQERDVLVQLEAAPGTSLMRMDEITSQVVADLRAHEGVTGIGAHVGRAILSDQLVNVNEAEVWLTIDPSADYAGTLEDIREIAAAHGDVASSVTTYSERRVTEILGEGADELVVRVYGENPDERLTMAEQVQSAMTGTEGIASVRIEAAAEEPAIEIEVDLARAQAFGVKPGDVRRQAATLLSGIIVGNLFEDQKVFDVVVWGKPDIRDTVDDVTALPIATPSGDQVPLGDLADVRIAMNPTVIRHESVATYIDVAATVSGRSMAAVAADVDDAIKEMQFPLEHHAEVLGAYADVSAARTRVMAAAAAAIILVYLLLQAAFTSWRLATLAFLALPMAVSGSIIAVALTGGDFELGSAAGTLAMFGIATRWVVLMIRRYQRRERLGEDFGQDLVVTASSNVVVPVVSSAIALVALFTPLVLVGGRAGLEVAAPAAVAVLGGMGSALLLTFVVLPALYLRWGYVANRDTSADDLFTRDVPATTSIGG